jgi:hypothetical protein
MTLLKPWEVVKFMRVSRPYYNQLSKSETLWKTYTSKLDPQLVESKPEITYPDFLARVAQFTEMARNFEIIF